MRPIASDITLNEWEKHTWLEMEGYSFDLTATQFGYPFAFIIRASEAVQGDYETATYDPVFVGKPEEVYGSGGKPDPTSIQRPVLMTSPEGLFLAPPPWSFVGLRHKAF